MQLEKVLVWTGSGVALAAIVAALASGTGYDAGFWHYGTGFTILRWSAYSAAAGAAVALSGSILALARRKFATAIVGVAGAIVALALILPTWNLQKKAEQVPPIHDITTDTDNPPQFVALLPVRRQTPNGPEYGGETIARQQKSAYPDIQPVFLEDPPARAFERALAAAQKMGWEIVAAAPADGRIEATATTRWFRFKDDVVIRATASATGSRIDIRSKSRIGRSDLGANAKRIRAFFDVLNANR